MNREQLRAVLRRENIRDDSYVFEGDRYSEDLRTHPRSYTGIYVLKIVDGEWAVLEFERGKVIDERRFANEDQACDELLTLLLKDPSRSSRPRRFRELMLLGVIVGCAALAIDYGVGQRSASVRAILGTVFWSFAALWGVLELRAERGARSRERLGGPFNASQTERGHLLRSCALALGEGIVVAISGFYDIENGSNGRGIAQLALACVGLGVGIVLFRKAGRKRDDA
jgi:hypothetical protein